MENLVKALDQMVLFLKDSEDSLWGSLSVQEIVDQLETEINKIKKPQQIDLKRLSYLFAPTGCIQYISIDNSWENEFIELSNIIDQFT